MHCRYCFRRDFPYADQIDDGGRWASAISTIASDRTISEVILSGGDPWTLGNRRLQALVASGVLPYYLHLLDPVQGVDHFAVGEAQGRSLIRDIAARLPGYLVPRLAREQAGEPAKTVIAAGYGREICQM